jgi:putative Ca2+/H+ antiporter (TMEM165/GDT1 family)
MFCGSVMLVLAVYFLFNKKENKKLRFISALYFLFMIFSFVFDEFN